MKNEQASLHYLYIDFPSSLSCQQRIFGISPCLTQSTLFCSHITRKTKQRQRAQVIRIKNTFKWKLRLEKRREIVGRHCVQTDRISFDITSFCTENKMYYVIKSFFALHACHHSCVLSRPKNLIYLSASKYKCMLILVDIPETRQWWVNSLSVTSGVVL